MAENIIEFQEGMPRLLPSKVLNEASVQEKNQYFQLRNQKYHQPKRHYSKPPAVEPLHNSNGRSSQLRSQRAKNGTNTRWAIGGPGMQAVFLDSGRRSSGTGVFLPPRAGTHFQSSVKPACPPVLLPSRVVQALNLNVHDLGLRIKPQQECASGPAVDCKPKDEEYIDASGDECCSPKIFLPKEWTY
ncbi:hypothetical protein ACH5RR_010673 [Cinchona calisaya]|uniref:Uncharacterized protein n=1 Tax=Cinchona calisaya TaxID=153742 RepID=A0ABD3AJQ1_9GENT